MELNFIILIQKKHAQYSNRNNYKTPELKPSDALLY